MHYDNNDESKGCVTPFFFFTTMDRHLPNNLEKKKRRVIHFDSASLNLLKAGTKSASLDRTGLSVVS
jgi:hypothetical protein